jgi:hypothetical protein
MYLPFLYSYFLPHAGLETEPFRLTLFQPSAGLFVKLREDVRLCICRARARARVRKRLKRASVTGRIFVF